MALEIKRPKGVTVFVILGILDAVVMGIFLAMFFGAPDMYWSLFDEESQMDLGQQYALVQFDDWTIGFGAFVIAVDALAVYGLLSAKPSGRKIAIGCAVAGIAFNVIIFGIPGLVSNSILVWYLFRTSTKQYFENDLKLS